MSNDGQDELGIALGRVPSGLFVATAAFEGNSAAVLASWVQRAGRVPPLLSMAIPKGMPIVPLIHDSHAFALCQLSAENRFLARRFRNDMLASDGLESIGYRTAITGSPLLTRALSCLDCELVRHFDLEADHDLYVGHVVAARSNVELSCDPLVIMGDPDSHMDEREPSADPQQSE